MALKVASLFAGIGGIELGFAQAGFQILWAIEGDRKGSQMLPHISA